MFFSKQMSKLHFMKKAKLFAIATGLLLQMGTISNAQDNTLKIDMNTDSVGPEISRHIYGQFSEHLGHCIYGGIWVGETSPIPNTRGIRNDVVAALKNLNIPNLRWPGGCFADEYHWMDGIGPRDKRPKMVNTNWGGVTEDNSFGTHEFLDLCEQLGTEPYICGNVGSGSVEEMSKWVEYITFDGESPMSNLRKQNGHEKPWKVKFWGVGNENWGCGGSMRPEYYADLYRRYATFCRNYGDNKLFKIAGGPNVADYNWMEVLMKNVGNRMNGVSLHNYTFTKSWNDKGSATGFTEAEYFNVMQNTLKMEELVTKHSAIMDKYDAKKKIGLMVDEWGAWYNVEPGTNPGFLYQQNTIRDAILAGINLNIFNNHADRVRMSNIAQVVNVLQSVILTDNEKMLLTPTYYTFEMYKVHMDATLIPLKFTSPEYKFGEKSIPAVSASASKDKNGLIHFTFTNVNPNQSIEVTIPIGKIKANTVTGKVLTAKEINSYNTFEKPEMVKSVEFKGAKLNKDQLTLTLPAKSVVMVEVK
jgi:alpha-N-arabinofuranosidase